MRIAIFGTGAYYNKFKTYFKPEDIVSIISNNAIPNEEIDGHLVIKPDELDASGIDKIYILVKSFHEIVEQLQLLGFDKSNIKTYQDIANDFGLRVGIYSGCQQFEVNDILDSSAPKVFILSHGYSLTGVPIALLQLALLFKEIGWIPIYGGVDGGPLKSELIKSGIYFTDELNIYLYTRSFVQLVELCDLSVIGSFALKDIGLMIQNNSKAMMWWCHESLDMYFTNGILKCRDNKDIFCGVGERAIAKFNQYYPNIEMWDFCYFIPELETQLRLKHDKYIISIIGSIEFRKAQDILLSAIEKISNQVSPYIKVIIAGKMSHSNTEERYIDGIKQKIDKLSCVEYVGEMSRDEITDLYQKTDLLVCPSRDDPMPIVVTEAMQRGIPCIVSTEVGQAAFIKNNVNGYVFNSESSEELSNALLSAIVNKEKTKIVGEQGREIYNKYFTKDVARHKLISILHNFGMQLIDNI